MNFSLLQADFQEDKSRVLAVVLYNEQVGEVYYSAKVTVFVPLSDSYQEVKRNAFQTAKEFLAKIVSE